MKTKTKNERLNLDGPAKTYTLWCRLRSHVITEEGDFIPAGTPVTVLGWSDTEGLKDRRIEVRTNAYMYAGDWETADESDNGVDGVCVGRGLYLSVAPDNLVYDEISEDWPTR